MKNVKLDFQERCDEIDLYFSFVEKVAKRGSKISFLNGKSEKIERDLTKTLKANGFIILYNLVESSITKAIEEIYIRMKSEKVTYDDIKEGIKRDLILHLKNRNNPDTFVSSVNVIAEDIIEQCFSSETLFSGNIDARKVRKTSEKYGFSSRTDNRKTRGGRELKTVKDQRNDLAHGVFSFQEVGKNYTEKDLLKIKKQVIAYVSQILDNIEIYINNREYLK